METAEIKIPVPWGYIAVKTWGDNCNEPILCFHGILDNAGSFNRLIKILPTSYYYIGIDLPGHGKSTHFPPNLPIYTLNYIMVYKIIFDYFRHKQYILMGHSYGGQLGYLFAQLYPDRVKKLIMLDTLHLIPVLVNNFKDYIIDRFEDFLYTQEKLRTKQQPTYTYEEALDRLQNNRHTGTISKEAAEALLQRSIERTTDGKFVFTVDQRLKNFINPIHDFRYILETMNKYPVKCPILIVLGKDSRGQQIFLKQILNYFQKNKSTLVKKVDGSHDVHNDSPELVAPYVISFLANQKSKL